MNFWYEYFKMILHFWGMCIKHTNIKHISFVNQLNITYLLHRSVLEALFLSTSTATSQILKTRCTCHLQNATFFEWHFLLSVSFLLFTLFILKSVLDVFVKSLIYYFMWSQRGISSLDMVFPPMNWELWLLAWFLANCNFSGISH